MAQGPTRGVPIDIDGTLSNNSDLLVPSQKAVVTYVSSGLSSKQNVLGYTPLNRAGDTMLGNLLLSSNPTLALQAATKDYVDTLINGVDWKQSAVAATVAALPAYTVSGSGTILTGSANGAIPSATTDGITLAVTNRVLVKNETSTLTPNNGIYVVTQVGNGSTPFILTRSDDANTATEIAEATISIYSGSTLSNTQWHCNPASVPITLGTTNITFVQIGSGIYTPSPPIAITGNVISITQATTSTNGYLSSTDWNTFNNKQSALSGTGFVKASGTTISYDNTSYLPLTGGTLTGNVTFNSTVEFNSQVNVFNNQSFVLWTTGNTYSVTLRPSFAFTASRVIYFPNADGVVALQSDLSSYQPILSGTGIVKSTSGTISYLTDNTANWDTAYTNRITSLTNTGSSGAATLISNVLNIPNYTLAGLGGISLTSLSASTPLSYNNTTGAFTIQVANTTQSGYLSSTDWNTFNSKEPALTKGNLTEATSSVLTISGGSSAVIGSGTTIQVKQSSSTQSGFLSSTDWNTFNGKESALTFSPPLSRSTNTISIPAATSSVNGYLSSTDWNTFNNKGTVTSVSGTGTVSGISLSGSVSTSGNLTLGGTLSVTPSNFATQTANTVLAGPTTGVAATPTFRALVAADIPTLLSYEPVISYGTTAQYWRGDKSWQTLNTAAVTESGNLYYTDARVLAALLTGYTLGTNTALAATDSVLGAFQKVQGQINAKEPAITSGTNLQYWRGDKTFQILNTAAVPESGNLYFTNARVLAATLTGYSLGTNTAITATDTLLTAFQNIQGQINARLTAEADTLATVTGRGATTSTASTFSGGLTVGGVGITYNGSTSGTTILKASAAAGTTTITMPATTGTMALLADIPTVNDATLTLNIGSAGATNTTVTIANGSGFSANTATNATYSISVGPALTQLATLMTTAGAGFIKRGATADTYSIDTNTYLTANQTITFTAFGDISASGTNSGTTSLAPTLTIVNSAVSLAKMANLAANSIIGNNTGTAATPLALTGTQVTAMLDTFSTTLTTKGLVPGSNNVGATYFLNANGGWTIPTGTATGTNTGDVTLATNSGLQFTSNQTGLTLGTPSTITTSSNNTVTTNTHTHAITPALGFIGNGSAQYQVPVTGPTTFTPAWTTATNLYGASGLNALTWSSGSPLIKMTAANTFALAVAGTDYLTTAITSLGVTGNLQTGTTQTLATGTSGTDFNITSASNTHTFNIPDASASARGLVTTGAQTIAGDKTLTGSLVLGINYFANSTTGASAGQSFTSFSSVAYKTGFNTTSFNTTFTNSSVSAFATNLFTFNGTFIAPSTGTYGLFTNIAVKGVAVSAATGAVTNASALYISEGSTGATNNYAVWVDAGTVRLDGDLELQGITSASTSNVLYYDTTTKRVSYGTVSSSGITGSGTANEIAYFNTSSTLASLATGTYPSLTELTYVKGVTSAIQTQLSGKVTAVSVTTANGISGSSSGGTTPALTLSLGAITPTTVNGLTFTAAATGFTIAGGTTSKTLTVSNTLTLAGTDGSTLNIGGGGTLGTAAFTASTAYEPTITTLGISKGGTGTTTAPTAFGVIYAASTTAYSSTSANTSTTKQFLSQTGNGTVSAAPVWATIAFADVSGTLGIGAGGTGQTTAVAAFDALAPTTTLGDTIFHNGTDNVRLAGNITTTKQFLSQTGNGTISANPSWSAVSKSDVGLGSVENTALSTWAGSSNITTLGTITTGTWSGTAITAIKGGTGQTSYAIGDLLYADTTTSLAKLAGVAINNALISGGVSTAPSWGKIGLTTHISGTLAVGNGGTGTATAPTAFGVIYAASTSAYTSTTANTTNGVYFLRENVTASAAVAPDWIGSTGSGNVVLATTPSLTTPALSGETFSTSATVTAGTNAQGQAALTSDFNVITTATANPSGATLPTATTGRRIVISNRGANPVNIYPASGGTIDALAANASIQLAANGTIIFNASSSTQWYSFSSSSGGGTTLNGTGYVKMATTTPSYVATIPLADGGTNASITAAAGGVVYSTASALAVSAVGSANQVLISNAASAPSWISQSSIIAGSATNIASGAANQIVYQSNPSTTSFVTASTINGAFLRSGGSGTAPSWSTLILPNAATAGQLFYASASNTMGTLNIGTASQLLRVNAGATAPEWFTPTYATTLFINSAVGSPFVGATLTTGATTSAVTHQGAPFNSTMPANTLTAGRIAKFTYTGRYTQTTTTATTLTITIGAFGATWTTGAFPITQALSNAGFEIELTVLCLTAGASLSGTAYSSLKFTSTSTAANGTPVLQKIITNIAATVPNSQTVAITTTSATTNSLTTQLSVAGTVIFNIGRIEII